MNIAEFDSDIDQIVKEIFVRLKAKEQLEKNSYAKMLGGEALLSNIRMSIGRTIMARPEESLQAIDWLQKELAKIVAKYKT